MHGEEMITIDQLEKGMKIAEEVENDFGATLVVPGMIVSDRVKYKLQQQGVKRVKIIKEADPVRVENLSREEYRRNVERMKNVFKNIQNNDQLDEGVVRKATDDLLEFDTNRDIIEMLNKVREVDEYHYTHSINVGLLSLLFGRWLKLSGSELRKLAQAGFLHDIGKAKVPKEILNKRGSLSPEEFAEVKRHPYYSYELINEIQFVSTKVLRAVLYHHERNDGSGYPLGVKKDKIPLFAKIVGISDVFAAMTSDRFYKNHEPPFAVFDYLDTNAKTKFDISLINTFIKNISRYYTGERVKLSNGQQGEIVFVNPQHVSQPIVKVAGDYIDLYQNDLEVEELLSH